MSCTQRWWRRTNLRVAGTRAKKIALDRVEVERKVLHGSSMSFGSRDQRVGISATWAAQTVDRLMRMRMTTMTMSMRQVPK